MRATADAPHLVWLSLDPGDNHPARLLWALAAVAVERGGPAAGPGQAA